jgi:hypothetical protein
MGSAMQQTGGGDPRGEGNVWRLRLESVAMSLLELGGIAMAWPTTVSESVVAVFLVLSGLIALLIILAKQRKLPWQKLSIRIGAKEKLKFRVEGGRKQNCPACLSAIKDSDSVVRCTLDPAHRIHRDCRTLVQSKCPQCGGRLE